MPYTVDRIEHMEEADAWLAGPLGKRSSISSQPKFDDTSAASDAPAISTAATPSTTGAVLDLETPASIAPTIDQDLPKLVKYEYTKDDFPMPKFQDIEVSQYKAPSPSDYQAGPDSYYTKDQQPSGKLDLFQQQNWVWPPPEGHHGTDPKAPDIYKGEAEARNLDSVSTLTQVNKESLAVIDREATEIQHEALDQLNQAAADQVAYVEMTTAEYRKKLQTLGEMRRALLSTVVNQAEKQKHQWTVKSRFYEADVESKQIFEEVQRRIADETQRRMDQAKKEVADQLKLHAQQVMQAKKGEVCARVDQIYEDARNKAKEESARLFVVQQQQQDACRDEYIARMKDRTKKLQQQEYEEAVNKAKSINIRINLDDEFRDYCAKRRI